MYVILGASGHTGRVVAETLLDGGHKVRVVGRSKQRLEGFTVLGGEIFEANVTDSAALTNAFRGAKAVYALVPPNLASTDYRAEQDAVTESLAKAHEAAGVSHVVALSSFGADKTDKTGPIAGLHVMEERLSRIPKLNSLFLRAGYFMENILPQVSVIQAFGSMAGPVRADLPLPMIATRDIGAAAAEILARRDIQGKQRRELLGARDVTYAQLAKIVGTAIGKPNLQYQQFGAAQLKPALMQMGMSANMVDLLLEMSNALNSGYMRALEPRSAQNTTPTTIETFVSEVLLPVFRMQAARA